MAEFIPGVTIGEPRLSLSPQGAISYFLQAYRNDQHSKLLLMSPGRDRSGSIGFRCAADATAVGP